VFWVISVYFNIRNTLPKSGTFLLGHPVCVCVCIYIYIYIYIYIERERERERDRDRERCVLLRVRTK
jgi:hypothetical protein